MAHRSLVLFIVVVMALPVCVADQTIVVRRGEDVHDVRVSDDVTAQIQRWIG